MTATEAREIGERALGFLVTDPQRLVAFLQTTGLAPADVRAAMDAPETLAAVLDYLLSDESLLLVFAAETGTTPERVAPAQVMLSGRGGET
jgi:hypothetical protein